MPLRRRNVLILIAFMSLPAAASEHGGGGGEGHGAPAEAAPKEQREFNEKTIKLTALASRLADQEKRFAEVVHHKHAARTPEEKQHAIHELVEIAGQRNKDVVEFEKLKSELSLRYPSQGEKLERHYGSREAKSAEDLESSLAEAQGLDELLTGTKRLIEEKYAPLDPRPSAARRSPAAAHVKPSARPRLRLEK